MKKIVLIAFGLLVPTALAAQGFNLSQQGGEAPLEISADDGVEWEQNGKRMIARGNATAVRGDLSVQADTLMAYYGDAGGGTSDLQRIEGVGAVRISSPTETAYGDNAVYDMVKSVLVMRGKNLRIVAQTATISAEETLEYWEGRNQAVARGHATVTKAGRTITGDVITANFNRDQKTNDLAISTMEAFDNVVITTESETAYGDKGTYDVNSGVVTLEGSVKIVRGENVLNGHYAQVNLNTGKSALYSTKPGSGKVAKPGRVQMHIVPGKKK